MNSILPLACLLLIDASASPSALFGASAACFNGSKCDHPLCTVLSQFEDAAFTPNEATLRGLQELKGFLTAGGYTVENAMRATASAAFDGSIPDDLAFCGGQVCARAPETASPLEIAISLFLRFNVGFDAAGAVGTPRAAAERALGVAAVSALVELGVLVEAVPPPEIGGPSALFSMVQLVPYDGLVHVATDFNALTGASFQKHFDPVMSLGLDTAGLAYGAPRNRTSRRLLDLCTGSGVQAIVAAMHYAEDVTLVDLNPRAVRFARFNLLLNGLSQDRARVYSGNLYDALPAGTKRFDTILGNPPFLPGTTLQLSMFGAGGKLGNAVTRDIVAGAGRWLLASAQGGEALRIVATIYNHDDYEALLRAWVGQWGEACDDASGEAGAKDEAAAEAPLPPPSPGGVDIGLFTGDVWSMEVMQQLGFLSPPYMEDSRDIRSGGNALIFVCRRGPRMDGEAATVEFRRRKLHAVMWQSLRSETVLRYLMQFLLRREFDSEFAALPDTAVTYYTANREQLQLWGDAYFMSVWTTCITQLHLLWVQPGNLEAFPALPRMQQERLLRLVNSYIERQDFGGEGVDADLVPIVMAAHHHAA